MCNVGNLGVSKYLDKSSQSPGDNPLVSNVVVMLVIVFIVNCFSGVYRRWLG